MCPLVYIQIKKNLNETDASIKKVELRNLESIPYSWVVSFENVKMNYLVFITWLFLYILYHSKHIYFLDPIMKY